jgi:hypothetical protein
MTATSLDNIAIGLALGAILMRLLDRPRVASLLSTVSLIASILATMPARRKPTRPD